MLFQSKNSGSIDIEKYGLFLFHEIALIGLPDYALAKSYIDKFFQLSFQVNIPQDDKIDFAKDLLKQIDDKKQTSFLTERLKEYDNTYNEFNVNNEFSRIVSYLSTPRAIKKWSVMIQVNYLLITCLCRKQSHVLAFLGFIAVLVKHPVILENLSRHTVKFLRADCLTKTVLVDDYEININEDTSYVYNDQNIILLLSAGVLSGEINKKIKRTDSRYEWYKEFVNKITVEPINDSSAIMLNKFFKTIDVTSILFFIEGYTDKLQVTVQHDFFEGDCNKINKVFDTLVTKNQYGYKLARHLDIIISSYKIHPKSAPDSEKINALYSRWREMEPFYRSFA